MIRTLQKKFVVTAMIAVTVLLAVLLGGINLANVLTQTRQSDRLLQSLAMQEGFGSGFRPEGEPRGRRAGMGDLFREPMDEDQRLSALYFVVRLDGEDAVQAVDLRHIASVDEEEAAALALQADSGRGCGRIGTLKYQFVETSDGCRSCVFLDVGMQQRSLLRVAVLSSLAGLLAWCAMLVLIRALSRRAIRPIAENMARQRQFVTDAGHELKTPLAIIQANVDAMELTGGENKYSRNIRSQARRLSGLTQNLLTLARLDESSVLTDLAPVSLSELAAEQLEMFRAPAELKGQRLESDIAPNVGLRGSRQQLGQLLSILLDNAVKYCPEGGRISLRLSREDRVVLRLANTLGPEGADPERIFDRFYRADSARSQSGGYGIGLSAAQAIVRLHKGEISAACADGEIVFTVRLPEG